MRTREARKLRDRALKDARKHGHNMCLISKSGAMELYGCLNQGCNDTIDCWDSPSIVNGPLPHVPCRSVDRKTTCSKLKIFFNSARKMFFQWRKVRELSFKKKGRKESNVKFE